MTPRIRTINEAYKEIKANDPNTAITPYAIRRLVISGTIPCITAGNKYLVNLDSLQEYLNTPGKTFDHKRVGVIRKISERA